MFAAFDATPSHFVETPESDRHFPPGTLNRESIMAKKKAKPEPRYVANEKLPADWNTLLKLGDFSSLSESIEREGKPGGFPKEQYEALREVGRIDRTELGIALFCMASVFITFFVLR